MPPARAGRAPHGRGRALVESCDFEITAPGCVDTIVTDLALLRRTADGFRIDEVARGFTAGEVQALTGMTVSVAGQPGVMQDSWR